LRRSQTHLSNSHLRDPLQSELQPHSMHLSFWQDLLPGQSELKEHSVHLPDSQRLLPGQSELKSHSSHLPFLQLPAALEPLSGAGQSEFHLQVWSFTQTPLGEHLSPLLQCQSSLHSIQNPTFLHPPRWLSQAQLQNSNLPHSRSVRHSCIPNAGVKQTMARVASQIIIMFQSV